MSDDNRNTDDVTRYSLIELGGPTEAPTPVATPERAEPARLESTWTTQVVSERAAALVAEEQRTIASLVPELAGGLLLYGEGTAFAASGWDTQTKQAAEHDARPLAADLATSHTATITAEGRRNRVIGLAEWRVDADGRLAHTTRPEGKAALTPSAWGRLVAESAAVTGTVAVPANVNSWIGRTPADRTRVARVRAAEQGAKGDREIFALVSERYAVLDSDAIVRALAARLPSCRGTVEYDRATTRTRIRLVDQAPIDVPALSGVGRIHSVGVELSTRDDGMGSVRGRGMIERRRCLNASVSALGTAQVSRRHLGTTADMVAVLDEVIGSIPALITELRGVWSRAAAEYYLDSETGARLDAPEAIARLVAAGHLPRNGETAQGAVDRYVDAWRAEDSPHSAAGVIMAVQRAAHEGGWRTKWADEASEDAAAGLLYQQVSYRLAEIDA